MLNLAQMAGDLTHMINDLPTAVTWGSQTFNAIVPDIGSTDSLQIEGITGQAALTVDYVLASVTGTIAENDLVVIGGVSYRAVKPFILPDGLTGRFECVGEFE
jgi:hypothetical protein